MINNEDRDRAEAHWKAAKKLSVVRGSKAHGYHEVDNGVKFFVLFLEKLGIKTLASCEGHKKGFYKTFYVVFYAPIALARRIVNASDRAGHVIWEPDSRGPIGYSVKAKPGYGIFRIAIKPTEGRDMKIDIVSLAEDWEQEFGCLTV